MKMPISVMLAWIVDIQTRRIRPQTSMSIWIPFHAGMTQPGVLLKLIQIPSDRIFKGVFHKLTLARRRCKFSNRLHYSLRPGPKR